MPGLVSQEVCDRVLFLSRGRILLQGEPKALVRERGAATLEDLFIEVAGEAAGEPHEHGRGA